MEITESKPRRNIWVIDEHLEQLAATIASLMEEESTDETVLDGIEDYFDQIEAERDAKLDGYATFISEQETLAKIRKDEAKRLTELAKIAENKAKRAKALLKIYLGSKGITKLETMRHKFSIRNVGGALPLIYDPSVTPDSTKVPDELVRKTIVYEFDAGKIREKLDQGDQLPFVWYGERGTTLRIE